MLIVVHLAKNNKPIMLNTAFIIRASNFSKGSEILYRYRSNDPTYFDTLFVNESIEKIESLIQKSNQ